MSQPWVEYTPNIDDLITEDETPVDNLPSEKQQRLLTEPLYSSWNGPGEGRTFLAAANVGVFYMAKNPAIVPDVFLSLDVEVAEDWWSKEHRSYFIWEFGKPPDVVIEIVSNLEGKEATSKLDRYGWMRVSYYVIYDPQQMLSGEVLSIYKLNEMTYDKQTSLQFSGVKLGLTLWEGEFEGKHTTWLRWTDEQGKIIPTGKERAEQERQRAEQERQRAEQERQRADQESQRAEHESQRADQEHQEKETALLRVHQVEQQLEEERLRAQRLAELLRQLGTDPNQL